MSRVSYQCDECKVTTANEDPFTPKPSLREEHAVAPHWLRVDGKDFCSPGCSTKHWVGPVKDSIKAAREWLTKAEEQLDYRPDAMSGDMLGVQLPSRASGWIGQAVIHLRRAMELSGTSKGKTQVVIELHYPNGARLTNEQAQAAISAAIVALVSRPPHGPDDHPSGCCNSACDGEWGTNCYCCHHGVYNPAIDVLRNALESL